MSPLPSARFRVSATRMSTSIGLLVAGAAAALALWPSRLSAATPTVAERASGELLRRVYHATRIASAPPEIDGKLDDPCWSGPGEWSGNYTQQEPDEGHPPSQPTQLKILHDDRYLYVAIRAFDTELARVPHLRGKRDEFTGDMVGITFDSFHDRRTAFEFNVTSGGSKIDLQIRDQEIDLSWNAVWDVRVALEPDAWTAEYRIPFSQLRYARQAEQVWGLHSWRWIMRRQEESDWNPIPRDTTSMVFDFGELRGIAELPPARRIELLPYALARYERTARETANPYRTGSEHDFDAGLDAKIGLSSDFTLDLTLNPDFGQVEADPSEINLTTYETFFEERRPFFLEGKDVLTWELGQDQLFYSRRIGQRPTFTPTAPGGFVDVPNTTRIVGAAKLTGKTRHGFAAGGLYAQTPREHSRIFENGSERHELVEPATQYVLSRAQQELAGGRTIVGGMATATLRSLNPASPAASRLPDRALTSGFDFLQRWHDRDYEFAAQVTGSRVEGTPAAIQTLMQSPVHNYQRPDADHVDVRTDADSLSGHGGRLRLAKVRGRWRYFGNYGWRSPGLELNDLGYLFEADRHRFVGGIDHVVTTPGRFIRNYEAHLAHYQIYDFGGTQLNHWTELYGEVRLNTDWRIEPWIIHSSEDRDTHMLRGGPSFLRPGWNEMGVRVASPGTQTWSWYVEGEREVSRAGGSGRSEIEAGFTWRALGLLTVQPEIEYENTHNDAQYVATTAVSPGGAPRYLLGRMDQRTLGTTIRVDANFTPVVSLSWYGSLFASSGDFREFKRVTNPLANRYPDRFVRLDGLAIPDAAGNTYVVTEGGENYTFANPDFDLRELQSNLVLRWEYQAGSTVYLVWTQNRVNANRRRGFSVRDEYRRLLSSHPDNTFLVKVSYWFAP